jgi:hypothetical protein
MSLTSDDLQRTFEFRERLVAYMNRVLARGPALYSGGLDAATSREIAGEQGWLAQEYGRLYRVINRYGPTGMSSPAIGMISQDVVQDAIHDVGTLGYNDIARLSVQHLDTTIGRMRGELERRASARNPETIYRLTSPVYWLQVVVGALVRLWGSTRGRVAAVAGALVVAVMTAFVSGVAQALVQSWFGHQ